MPLTGPDLADRNPTPEVTRHHSGWAKPCHVCQLTVVRQDWPVITELFAVAAQSAPGAVNALNSGTPPHAFGVQRAAAVIALISALSLAAMILGGHLRASLKRRRADKDH
jgi:hypothetical protein